MNFENYEKMLEIVKTLHTLSSEVDAIYKEEKERYAVLPDELTNHDEYIPWTVHVEEIGEVSAYLKEGYDFASQVIASNDRAENVRDDYVIPLRTQQQQPVLEFQNPINVQIVPAKPRPGVERLDTNFMTDTTARFRALDKAEQQRVISRIEKAGMFEQLKITATTEDIFKSGEWPYPMSVITHLVSWAEAHNDEFTSYRDTVEQYFNPKPIKPRW